MAKKRVFLVDDDPAILEMMKDHLSDNLKVDITTFSTGEDCLRNMDKKPEAIVLDYNLNSVEKDAQNGFVILKEIKNRQPDCDVVILSGQDKIDVAIDTMKYGAFDYVVKNESAFKRCEITLINIFKAQKTKEMLRIYKFSAKLLGGILAVILIGTAILSKLGLVALNPSWY